MGVKKSFLNSPLSEPKGDDSQFDFVEDQRPRGTHCVSSIFKYIDSSSGMQLVDSFSEKVVRKAEEAKARAEAEAKLKAKATVAEFRDTEKAFKEAADTAIEMEEAVKESEKTSPVEEAHISGEKKIASYYINVETLADLKSFADQNKLSYSSVVEQALRKHLASMKN